MAFALRSDDFEDGGRIPPRFTCEGENVSPHLAWSGVPEGSRSLALVVDDPDAPDPEAPKMTWVHWVVYDLPPDSGAIGTAQTPADFPPEVRFGRNDFQRTDYGGPCPPIGRHRYYFHLYALDTQLPSLGAATRADLDRAMAGHVLGEATLMGTYQKHS